MNKFIATLCLLLSSWQHSWSYPGDPTLRPVPDWSISAPVPIDGRANIYQLSEAEFVLRKEEGKLHAQIYPVAVTGLLPPYEPIRRFIEEKSDNPLRWLIQKMVRTFVSYKTFDQVLKDLGLHRHPGDQGTEPYTAPWPRQLMASDRMGIGLVIKDHAVGFTMSCAACHSAELFGKTVLGMTNRFPRANEFFLKAQKAGGFVHPSLFQKFTGATDAETQLLSQSLDNLKRVGVKKPLALGLDTSLAQVALSLNKRSQDDMASPSWFRQNFPRPDEYLDTYPADSKPAVWWNLKYKNRWLSDGSVLSGNPIVTNLLWNEIGRGTDLSQLEKWIDDNEQIIQELTTAVFATQAPHITDFFSEDRIQLDLAKKGEELFNQSCAKCHGIYEKNWSHAEAHLLSKKDLLKTSRVRYPQPHRIVDVGTDSHRYLGMKSLEKLNDLKISKNKGILIRAQKGYLPPPLVGIWARWPYFHNNSVPSLCAVLTPGSSRPVTYYSGPARNPDTDFDFECNGYPLDHKTPESWKQKAFYFDTRTPGLWNRGHDERIFIKDGREIFSREDKKALIQFLQTL